MTVTGKNRWTGSNIRLELGGCSIVSEADINAAKYTDIDKKNL